jgi:NAD(P)-dependent dehydrogenase (short-subunit alcohol dehydrogenase family)
MVERRWGRIINFAGMNSIRGYAKRTHIAASKHAVWGLTKALSREFGPHNITVNAISPGPAQSAHEDAAFDAILCIDAINHLPDRLTVLGEWRRMLKPGGRLLFTDPLVMTGIASSEEVAIRSSMGLAFYTPPNENARLIQQAGLTLEREEDATANVTLIGERRVRAREARRAEVIAREGQETFDRLQRFYAMAQTLASEGRLSRCVFFARKTP